MRPVLTAVLSFLTVLPAVAQDWDSIREDPRYVWGEGWGQSVEEADREALASLSFSISAAVSSRYRQVEEQLVSTEGTKYTDLKRHELTLSSGTTLTHTSRVVLRTGRKAHVGRWISREELEAMLSDRKARVLEYEWFAREAEAEARLDDALRYHYWASALLRTLSRPSVLRDEGGRMLVSLIPERMNSIFENLSVTASKDGDWLTLSFEYRGRKVRSLDFSYFDGSRWSTPMPVREGMARVAMAPGALAEVIQLRIQYAYRGEAFPDDELSCVLSSTEPLPLKKSLIIFRRR